MILLLWLALAIVDQSEIRPVPKDSMMVEARGCLKGRVFTATSPVEHDGALRGPDISGKHFRINGKKDLINQVKQHDGGLVEITGVVRKADLSNDGVGFKLGRARVVIGAQGSNPSAARNTPAAPMMPTMDALTLVFVQERCPI